MKVIKCAILLCAVLFLVGCNSDSGESGNDETSQPAVTAGTKFVSTGFKIKSIVTPHLAKTLDPMLFEVYVDSNGTGKGLMQYLDKVYEVYIVKDSVFVRTANDAVVRVSEITGHMVPTYINIGNKQSLETEGFQMLSGVVAHYALSDSTMIVDSAYQESSATFEVANISEGNSVTIAELANLLMSDSDSDKGTQTDAELNKESFYNNSWLGVKIHDRTYSIGDYCNPSTFFENSVPEGLNPTYEMNAEKKVEFLYVSYISSDGNTTFVTTDGYVQKIVTTSQFEFLGIKTGDDARELGKKLGIGLSNSEQEAWRPIVDGLTAERGRGNSYVLTYNDITATIEYDNDYAVNRILLEKYLDFVQ